MRSDSIRGTKAVSGLLADFMHQNQPGSTVEWGGFAIDVAPSGIPFIER